MKITACDDWPKDLQPLNETRTCDKCGAYTWWASPKQRKKGRCWDCVPGLSLRPVTKEHEQRVIELFLKTFPGATVEVCRTRVYRPGAYQGPNAGPCVRCRGTILRYGPDGSPLCADCLARKEAS